MRYSHVRLRSFGYELPPRIVSSAALEDRLAPLYEALRLPVGRLELISGVRERRFWEPGTRPSEVSTRTAREAIARAGLEPAQVGALVHTSVCRDYLEPATASVVGGALGLAPDALVYDISNACLGFMNGVLNLANMIELGQLQAGVVVATESGEPLVEATLRDLLARAAEGRLDRKKLRPSFASLTIGSGSVAAVLTHADLAPASPRLVGGWFAQGTEHSGLCRSTPDQGFADGAHPLMETDSEEVLQQGCALAARTWSGFQTELGWTTDTPDRLFCHQVGAGYRRKLFEALKLDLAKDYPTLEVLGNIGSVSLPISLAIAEREGALAAGETLALLGIGSGLNSIMLGVEWA